MESCVHKDYTFFYLSQRVKKNRHQTDKLTSVISVYFFIVIIVIVDIDECAADAHNCSQICKNELGTFQCVCNPGYELSADGENCDSE